MPAKKKTAKKKTGKVGRPSVFEKARPKILKRLREGNFLNQAALSSGIVYRTFRDWIKAGQAEIAAVKEWELIKSEDRTTKKPRLTKFAKFVEEVELAEAEGEAALVAEVRSRNPLEILKRRHHERWGDKKRVSLEGGGEDAPPVVVEGAAPVVVNLTFEDPDDSELWIDGTEEEPEAEEES